MAQFFLPPSTASTREPRHFAEGDEVVVRGTDEVGTVTELRRGHTPLVIVEYDNGATVEVPGDRLVAHKPKDVPETWPTDPDERTAGWVSTQWLKTLAHQSAWMGETLFSTEYEVGDRVTGPLGPAVIDAVGHSPLGTVYRVKPIMGGESYDLMEDQIQTDRTPAFAHLASLAK